MFEFVLLALIVYLFTALVFFVIGVADVLGAVNAKRHYPAFFASNAAQNVRRIQAAKARMRYALVWPLYVMGRYKNAAREADTIVADHYKEIARAADKAEQRRFDSILNGRGNNGRH